MGTDRLCASSLLWYTMLVSSELGQSGVTHDACMLLRKQHTAKGCGNRAHVHHPLSAQCWPHSMILLTHRQLMR